MLTRGIFFLLGFLWTITLSLGQYPDSLSQQRMSGNQFRDQLLVKNVTELLELSREMLDSDPENAKISADIALKLAHNENNEAAEISALYLLGEVRYRLNEYDSALVNYRNALQKARINNIDSFAIKILISLGSTYQKKNQSEFAIQNLKEAIKLAEQEGFTKQKIIAELKLASVYHGLSRYQEALSLYQQDLKYEDSVDNQAIIADIYNRIGVVFYDLGSYEKSLEYYMKSLDIVEKMNDLKGKANALNNIGIVYYDWGKKEKALEYYQRSLQIEESLENELGIADSYNNIGIIYSDWNQNDLAIDYYTKALNIYQKYSNRIGISNAKNNIGESLAATGHYSKAISNLLESLKIERQYGTSLGIAQSLHSIAKTYFAMGEINKAEQYNKQCYVIADSCGLISVLPEVSYLDYQIDEKRGRYKSALEHYISYDQQKKSIYDQQFHDRITELQLKHEIDRNEREREQLKLENSKKEHEIKTQRTYLFIIFILMLIFGSLVYYDIKSKMSTNRSLKEFNSELSKKKESLTKALNQLRKSELKYRNLVENAPTGILYIDEKGKILEINKMMLNILGSPSEEETKKINILTYEPLKKTGIADTIQKCLKTGNSLTGETEYITKWGKELYLKFNMTPVYDDKTDSKTLILNIEDISKSRKADILIRESENKYRMLVENSLQAMLIIQDMKILFANNKLEEITGYTIEELESEGRNWLKLIIHPEDVRKSVRNVVDALRGKAVSNIHEYRIKNKNGQIRWIETLASVVKFHNKPAMMMVALDITERKKAEQILIESETQLKNANAMKDKFFSIIAHDLKNPFSSILGFANLLYEAYENFSESQRKHFVKNIVETSENTFKLLQNLLEWARTQTGNFEYQPRQINLSTLTNENVAIFKTSLKNKKINVDLKVPVNLMAWADENMIKTVIRNLLSNAVKFTRDGGQITIHATTTNKQVEYCVEDNGVGISKENIKKMFRLDDPLKQPGTNNETGSGIGLLLCKELVEINGGTITVESELDAGSKFTFTLPRSSR